MFRSVFVSDCDMESVTVYDSESVSAPRSEEHTSELQSRLHLVCRLLLEKKKSTASDPPANRRNRMKITITATGYVGIVTGPCLSVVAHGYLCLDLDALNIAHLDVGCAPI